MPNSYIAASKIQDKSTRISRITENSKIGGSRVILPSYFAQLFAYVASDTEKLCAPLKRGIIAALLQPDSGLHILRP